MERRTFLTTAAASLIASRAFAAAGPGLKLLSSMAAQGALETEIAAKIVKSGIPFSPIFSATVPITEQIQKGETADLVLIGKGAVATLTKQGFVHSSVDLFVSEEGIAVADKAPTPVIRNKEDFRQLVAAAPSIAITKRGVSGLRLQQMLRDLGLTEVLDKRAVLVDEGFTATRLLKGEVAMAVQQLSELKAAGAKNFVRFPDEMQVPTTFTVAILKSASNLKAAEDAVRIMASKDVAGAWEKSLVAPLNK
jgi:molybdate transport system substrate-binding protein